ncbi:hypothetical protein ARALYDRAFT_338097 [Arabidopsis lyrata subsp. lyrata]|uniref:Uncharacterized protein n=1 Tax=Arabidopsis lyrata subsp. lyrata TaxID=81972 RepID=D7KU56_ARALL|nr:hypothetical protein ARALYDRAFT_338097 [Arabidopsis lyrata subsp. lyrata]
MEEENRGEIKVFLSSWIYITDSSSCSPWIRTSSKACSFVFEEQDQLSDLDRQREAAAVLDDSRESSETVDDDGSSDYDSESSIDSDCSSDGDERTVSNGVNDPGAPLIQISVTSVFNDPED